MNDHDALLYIIRCLREGGIGSDGSSNYGYEVYIPNVVRSYFVHERNVQEATYSWTQEMYRESSFFLSAAWELSRRGILRPGVHTIGAQATDDGSGEAGYSITPFGRSWLSETTKDDFVSTEPERFGQMLGPYKKRYGPAFYERAQEAVRCYGAHAYLACCAMCGAASESVLLAAAIKKTNKETVLSEYNRAGGRVKIENMLIGKAKESLQREFRGFSVLIRYWRDEAAHGKAVDMSDNEAYTSLALLLRFAMYVDENWSVLTKRESNQVPKRTV